jgi:hypothetical protein
MAKFGGQFLKATTSTTVGVASLEAAAASPRRVKLCELILGSDAGTLGTSNFRWDIQRSTATSTGTTVTPNALDPADSLLTAIIKSNLTVQGTNTAGAIPLSIPLSQQASFRWVANPGYELVIPAVASNGFHINTPVAGNTPSAAGSIIGDE